MNTPSDPPKAEALQLLTTRPEPVMTRYRLVIAYDGTLFHGWQKQEPPDGMPLRTVAGVVESTLIRTLGQPLNLVGASRTDSGVHALGQVAQFDAATRIPIERLAQAVNSRLPEDVEVLQAEVASFDFSAISGARSKQYRYRIFNADHRPLGIRHLVWHCWWKLDVAAMNEGASRLLGEHDFAGLASIHHGRSTTVRTIHDCRVEVAGEEIHIVVSGSGFLYNMVRILAGTLVEIGRGRFKPEVIDNILAKADRTLAGPTLPAQGLWLEWIRYDE